MVGSSNNRIQRRQDPVETVFAMRGVWVTLEALCYQVCTRFLGLTTEDALVVLYLSHSYQPQSVADLADKLMLSTETIEGSIIALLEIHAIEQARTARHTDTALYKTPIASSEFEQALRSALFSEAKIQSAWVGTINLSEVIAVLLGVRERAQEYLTRLRSRLPAG